MVDSSFNSKVEQHATNTEMQATADLNKRFDSLQGEVDLLSKARTADQIRIDKLSSDNEAMQNQLKALGETGCPEGELAPTLRHRHPVRKVSRNQPVIRRRPGAGGTASDGILSGNGMAPPPQVSYQSVPVPNQIQRKTFSYDKGKNAVTPYIPSGSFAKSMLIEGGRCQRVCYREMNPPYRRSCVSPVAETPNSKPLISTGFVGFKARATYRVSAPLSGPRNISCIKGDKPSISPQRHVSFAGKTGLRERW